MKFLTILIALAGLSIAVPDTHVVHERRSGLSPRWARRKRVSGDAVLPVRLGLAQTNLDKAHEYLMEISDPSSSKYGQIWTANQVIEAFKPTEDTVDAVKRWLSTEGIHETTHSDNKGWIAFDAPARVVERLLHTEYYEHHELEHQDVIVPACDHYHVPKEIQSHIDYITPGVRLVGRVKGQFSIDNNLPKRQHGERGASPLRDQRLRYKPDPNLKTKANLTGCDELTTPDCIQALYEYHHVIHPNKNNSMGIYGSFVDQWNQEDLNNYFTMFSPRIPNGTHPLQNLIDGAVAKGDNGAELLLDLQISYPIVFPQTITVWDEGDLVNQGPETSYNGWFNTWLDAMDGSYCSYSAYGEKGDDTKDGLDPAYPDPAPGGYKGKLQCGVYKPTTVISISYTGPEADYPIAYQKRQCNEFAKLGLQGTSFFWSSGDYGVGQPYTPDNHSGCLGEKQNIFSPNWPTTCPYVTTVGATQIVPGHTVFEPESAAFEWVDESSFSAYSSTGGFSNVYGVPEYQKHALETYFNEHDPKHPYYSALPSNAPNPTLLNITQLAGHTNGVYNRLGRGIPDVAANGGLFPTYHGDFLWTVQGTSGSAPIFASIVNLINNERMNSGKSPVGFINPALYAFPSILHDITNGTNAGCGGYGFSAVRGWDPVTGLGTPNYPKMLDLFMSLP